MLASFPLFVLPLALTSVGARVDRETPLATTITEVSVHRDSALVKRRAALPSGDGRYVIPGLPPTLVPDSVQLRLVGAEANDLTVRAAAPDVVAPERIAAIEQRIESLAEQLDRAADALALRVALRERVEALLAQEATAHAQEMARGRPEADAWNPNYRYLGEQLRSARSGERAATEARQAAEAALSAARDERATLRSGGPTNRFDLSFSVVALDDGALSLELDYEVGNAHWMPRYDLRADATLAKVALTYRAEVTQQTGEDWRDVALFLSTAEPRRGVVGPIARATWIDLARPRDVGRSGFATAGYAKMEFHDKAKHDADNDEQWSAQPEQEGLSLRYQLPRKETIESRASATTVLVTQATLAVEGERVCTPARDLDVWIRARTKNDSPFVLLPGPAAVFFGDDFVGPAALELVRPGQEFTLHLGRDPGFVVTRHHVEDQQGSAGLFGSKSRKIDRWRVRIENQAGLASSADGRVVVQVRETLPLAQDDRIDVELDDVVPPLARSPRFDRDRSEKGILTWEVSLARGAVGTVEWKQTVTWPDDAELLRGAGGVGSFGGNDPPWLRRSLAGAVVALIAGLAAYRARRHRRHQALPATALLLAALAASPTVATAQQVIDSRIERVTVYGAGALVERHATLPGAGTFVLRDLPISADPTSIRLRLEGGEIVSLELRERQQATLPDAQLAALRARHQGLERELAVLNDERVTLEELGQHLRQRMIPQLPTANSDGARPNFEAWSKEAAFLESELAAQQEARRSNARAIAAKNREVAAAARDLAGDGAAATRVRDVLIDAFARQEGPLACTLSYLVAEAGWSPEYDVRAAKELDHVDLTYRARVWQATPEAWNDVALALSTAAPQRGAAGPDPQVERLSLRREERHFLGAADAAPPTASAEAAYDDAFDVSGMAGFKPGRAAPVAKVADQGISERFELPGRQHVAPNRDGQLLLIGRAALPLTIERRCVPAIDATVWLTGKATNTSVWTLLPGPTAVHLGRDYLGRGTLALAPKQAEVELHLGADPWIAVERVATADDFASSTFSSAGTRRRAWRLELRDHGAPANRSDGRIQVTVEEALPRARDERIEVTLEPPKPAPSNGAEAKRRRDEAGILTWELALPRNGVATLEWGYRVRFPESLELSFIEE